MLIQNIINPYFLAPLVIASAFIGQSVRYSNFYLFHLVILLFSISIVFRKKEFLTITKIFWSNKILLFPIFYTLYGFISIFWSSNPIWGTKKAIISSFGIFIFTAFIYVIRDKFLINKTKKLLLYIVLLHLVVSILEITTDFRWPISPMSNINHFFGIDYVYINKFRQNLAPLETRPNSLFWNTNEAGIISLFILTFSIFSNNIKYSALIPFSVITIMYTTSRSSIFLMFIVLIISLLLIIIPKINIKKNLLVLNLILVSISLLFFKMSSTEYQDNRFLSASKLTELTQRRIKTGANKLDGLTNKNIEVMTKNGKLADNSLDRRILMSEKIWRILVLSPFFGQGLGSLKNEKFTHNKVKLNLT